MRSNLPVTQKEVGLRDDQMIVAARDDDACWPKVAELPVPRPCRFWI